MSRREGDTPHAMEFSALEWEALEEMRRITGCTTTANLIRTALWSYSEFLEMRIDLRLGVFDERHGSGTWRRPQPPKRVRVRKPKAVTYPGVQVAAAGPPLQPHSPAQAPAAPATALAALQRVARSR